MKNQLLSALLIFLWLCTACQDNSHTSGAAQSTTPAQLPPDVIAAVKPLISGNLYRTPDFKGVVLAHYDTLETLYILDTSNPVFVKARIKQDTVFTGYIPKIILPDYKKP